MGVIERLHPMGPTYLTLCGDGSRTSASSLLEQGLAPLPTQRGCDAMRLLGCPTVAASGRCFSRAVAAASGSASREIEGLTWRSVAASGAVAASGGVADSGRCLSRAVAADGASKLAEGITRPTRAV
mmetsp:Transcript_80726/g.139981  ORF Transcript_80726/g.139981 Transcript_80726/m.139981 type:complete len:127 (+) Transcript_80726:63-443(+)